MLEESTERVSQIGNLINGDDLPGLDAVFISPLIAMLSEGNVGNKRRRAITGKTPDDLHGCGCHYLFVIGFGLEARRQQDSEGLDVKSQKTVLQ